MVDLADYLKSEGDASDDIHHSNLARQSTAALTLGAVGVVYGDIGTSPIYALREALRATGASTVGAPEVLGVLSLLIWALIIIVTIKYVFVLLRADNRGEGGILALYTLVRLASKRRSIPILALAIAGAALFAGDAAITPAISVLSAVEGMALVVPSAQTWVIPATLGILVGLFVFQARGTASVAGLFGPVTVMWFLALAATGIWHLVTEPVVLAAFNPLWGLTFLYAHAGISLVVLGAVFLAVTGGEALYADLGHFGRKPVALAWLALVFPALVLNYLGQGAMVLSRPETLADPFFSLVGGWLQPALVLLATSATVIASQAVISGAFSMARAAVQLGFLPRLTIRHTAEGQSGQIYIASINWMLLFAVVMLVLSFKSSGALASAYGIAVTGTMVLTTLLGATYLVRSGRMSALVAGVVVAPVGLVELAFLTANLSKIRDGGYVPVLMALAIGLVMAAWWRGTQRLAQRRRAKTVDLASFITSMRSSSVHQISGTAFFLAPDPDQVPSALLHNLKHNRILHEQTVLLNVETLRVPFATAEERATVEWLTGPFVRLTLRFGFMETPNITRALAHARRAGLKFDVMTSTFFLGRRRAVPGPGAGLGRVLDGFYAVLARLSADPTAYYHLPRNRVVELGEQVTL